MIGFLGFFTLLAQWNQLLHVRSSYMTVSLQFLFSIAFSFRLEYFLISRKGNLILEAIAMNATPFPVIDPVATGKNIVRLRTERGLSVRDLQAYFGFEEPQAIYKWQQGKSLPTVDNLYALGALLEVSMNEILVSAQPKLHILSRHRMSKKASAAMEKLMTDIRHKVAVHIITCKRMTRKSHMHPYLMRSTRFKTQAQKRCTVIILFGTPVCDRRLNAQFI
jgi:transcriptional regulator with XRE-family HTH domain